MKMFGRICLFVMGVALMMAILGPDTMNEPFQLDFAWLTYFIAGGAYVTFGGE